MAYSNGGMKIQVRVSKNYSQNPLRPNSFLKFYIYVLMFPSRNLVSADNFWRFVDLSFLPESLSMIMVTKIANITLFYSFMFPYMPCTFLTYFQTFFISFPYFPVWLIRIKIKKHFLQCFHQTFALGIFCR